MPAGIESRDRRDGARLRSSTASAAATWLTPIRLLLGKRRSATSERDAEPVCRTCEWRAARQPENLTSMCVALVWNETTSGARLTSTGGITTGTEPTDHLLPWHR